MKGYELITQERRRQIEEEGFGQEHDSVHSSDVLVAAAIAYAMYDLPGGSDVAEDYWPWEDMWWKPKDHMKNLVRAGALIAAAIDRLKEEQEEQENCI